MSEAKNQFTRFEGDAFLPFSVQQQMLQSLEHHLTAFTKEFDDYGLYDLSAFIMLNSADILRVIRANHFKEIHDKRINEMPDIPGDKEIIKAIIDIYLLQKVDPELINLSFTKDDYQKNKAQKDGFVNIDNATIYVRPFDLYNAIVFYTRNNYSKRKISDQINSCGLLKKDKSPNCAKAPLTYSFVGEKHYIISIYSLMKFMTPNEISEFRINCEKISKSIYNKGE